MSTLTATPTKIKTTGAWGARVSTTDVHTGDVVTITTRAGKTWDAQVTGIVWTGQDVAICTTASLDRRPARSHSAQTHYDGGRNRRRGCASGGNCSSFGDSTNCGGYGCDGF